MSDFNYYLTNQSVFLALIAQEMDWLDKLEKRLKKSPKSAADAEEISEELDVNRIVSPYYEWLKN